MFPLNSWVFDLEIRRMIPDKYSIPIAGIEYCNSWGDHRGMGVSCLVTARPDGTDVRFYTNDIMPKKGEENVYHLSYFAALVKDASLLIGYGSRKFDAKVLACLGIYIDDRKHLDFLYEAKKKLRNQAPKGYKLEDVSLRCGGPRKTEDGALAPLYWQRGERQRVMNYCKNDIDMIIAIAQRYLLTGGCIPTPENAPLRLRTPSQIAVED